jgi:hypothetical protein
MDFFFSFLRPYGGVFSCPFNTAEMKNRRVLDLWLLGCWVNTSLGHACTWCGLLYWTHGDGTMRACSTVVLISVRE